MWEPEQGRTLNVLVIPDMHAPFQHRDTLDFLREQQKQVMPDEVVCVGDEIDAHGWSSHDRHPDAPGQGDELAAAVKFLKKVYRLFPRVMVCTSNHTSRAYRKAIRSGIPTAYMRDTREVLEAPPGWRWADHWRVDGVHFEHGEGFSGQNAALNAATRHRSNTCIGHVHAWAGVQFHSSITDTVWGMNVGCLVDSGSLAMAYAKTFPNKPVLGAGFIIDGNPYFKLMGG